MVYQLSCQFDIVHHSRRKAPSGGLRANAFVRQSKKRCWKTWSRQEGQKPAVTCHGKTDAFGCARNVVQTAMNMAATTGPVMNPCMPKVAIPPMVEIRTR